MEETRQDRIRRVSREWYARNKDRVRQRKLEQCHGYRRRLRAGRPPKAIKSMVFNINTGELTDLPIDETIITGKRTIKPEPEPEPDRTKIESGSFFVSFN